MKNLSRDEMKKIIGGQTIQHSCGYTGGFYVWCQSVITVPNGNGPGVDLLINNCWEGCVDTLTAGCSTTPIMCIPGTN